MKPMTGTSDTSSNINAPNAQISENHTDRIVKVKNGRILSICLLKRKLPLVWQQY